MRGERLSLARAPRLHRLPRHLALTFSHDLCSSHPGDAGPTGNGSST